MSVTSQITRIQGAVSNAYTAVLEKGGSVPSAANRTVANLADAIRSIQTGGGGATMIQMGHYTWQGDGTEWITFDYPFPNQTLYAYAMAGWNTSDAHAWGNGDWDIDGMYVDTDDESSLNDVVWVAIGW